MRKIFIVDDEALILKSLTRLLRQPDAVISPFSEPEQLLAALKEKPDLIVSDYHLPRIDGVTVVREAKRLVPTVKTVLLSGGMEDEVIAAAIKAGDVDRFLSKPWRHEELLEAIQELLGPQSAT